MALKRALIYHPPVAQIVIYHSQQVVWTFPHHRLDADVPSRGIERIAYVNTDQRAEPYAYQFLSLL